MEKEKIKNNKQVIFLFILVICAVLFFIGFVALDKKSGEKIITSGDTAPEFRLQTLAGHEVRLSDYRGKVVMVHFWATWCPPCIQEMPTLQKLYHHLNNKRFELLAVSVDEGGEKTVTAFMKNQRLDVPVLLDSNRAISGLYGTFRFPETYIVDSRGIVRYKAIGPRDWTTPSNVQLVQSIIETN
ncbi:MAG TPA: TlpA disulfide reductase family protein [Nitrospirota bacterium]|nr:TlpA disulfide reductase family protein [Nitrospirota bacterium]